jgi:hypothetical protein
MTPDDERAAAEQGIYFHERFAPPLVEEQAPDHDRDYVRGRMM